MPIYAYRCKTCGRRQDVYKRLADIDSVTQCPTCFAVMDRQISAPYIAPDYAGYTCPITDKWIEGRRAHQENLARHGCRVFEPGEREAFSKRRAAEEEAFDRKIDSTVEEFVETLPTVKRERLIAEVEGGLDVQLTRS